MSLVLAKKLDNRRRVLMPRELPPHSPVTISKVDDDTFIVRRLHPSKPPMLVLLESDVKQLPDDPEWEKKELALARHLSGKTPPPKF
jgi:hypothetical protein